MDLFVAPTIGFDLLYGLVIIRLARRDLVWLNVTSNPTAEWIARSPMALYCEIIPQIAKRAPGCCECRLQVLAADIFEINIDARGSHMQQGLGQIAHYLVVDDVVDTDLLKKGTLGRTACERPRSRA
jgi:hypothetical protein